MQAKNRQRLVSSPDSVVREQEQGVVLFPGFHSMSENSGNSHIHTGSMSVVQTTKAMSGTLWRQSRSFMSTIVWLRLSRFGGLFHSSGNSQDCR